MADDVNAPDASPAPVGNGAPSQPSAPPSQGSPPTGGVAPPMGAGIGSPIQALGRQAEARNKAKAIVTVLQRDLFGAFDYNSQEHQAIKKALDSLGKIFGPGNEQESNRNAAMMALQQRALASRGMQPPQPNRGPIPAMAGGGGMTAPGMT